MLAGLNMEPQFKLRDPKKKSNIVGKDLANTKVQAKLRKYAKSPAALKKTPDLQARVDALLGGPNATRLGAGTTTKATGVGSSAESSADGVGQLGGDVRGGGSTNAVAAPDEAPMGDSVRDAGLDPAPAKSEPGALATPPVTPLTGTPGRKLNTARQLIPGTKIPVNKQTLQATGKPRFVDDAYTAPRPTPARVEPDLYAALADTPDVSNEVAQRELDARFYGQKGKLAVRAVKFHEDNPALVTTNDVDSTTTGDKQAILALLDTPPSDLKIKKQNLSKVEEQRRESLKGAIAFFSKYRFPGNALEEIGVSSRAGEGKSPTGLKAISTDGEAFYYGQTKPNAIAARRWIEANLSPEANSLVTANAQMATRGSVAVPDTDMDTDPESADGKKAAKLRSDKVALDRAAMSDDALLFDDNMDFYDSSIEGLDIDAEMLLLDPVQGLNNQLMRTTQNGLRNGDLRASLLSIAGTNPVPRIRRIAAKLAEVVGTTKVQVVDDLAQITGYKTYTVRLRDGSSITKGVTAGMFDPVTNTISIDANNGMNVHTVLHEMVHAATSASLANPSLPEVKQLQTIFNTVREQMGEVYGTANLYEFVAEAFSNPEFQTALALTRVDGGKMSGWEKFTGAVRRIVRKLIGLQPKRPESALDEVDRIINGMLSPSPATRSAPSMMLLARTKAGAADLIRRNITAVPIAGKNYYEIARDFTQANTPRALRRATLAVQPVNNLARLAQEKIPYANELNALIDQQSGALRKAFEPVDKITDDWKAYKKANRAGYDRMQSLMNRATQDEVDPAMPRRTYDRYHMSYLDLATEKTIFKSFRTEQERAAAIKALNDDLKQKYGGQDKPRTKARKAGDPSAEKSAIWDTLNKEYKTLGKEGQRLYKVTREMGQAAQDRILPAIKARLDSLGVDVATQRTAFEKLADLMHAQGGVIRPYFKLSRGGDFRLAYSAPDPLRDDNGIELFAEYYHSEKDMMQAEQNVRKYLADIGQKDLQGNIETGKRDSNRNYGNAPSSSFVFEVLQTLTAAGVDQQTRDRIIDLSLDAIPERSFMQSFRSRKERSDGNRGILGALGDRTPSGMPGMDVDLANMFQDNFRGIEKQLVQLEFGAKIQKWRNRLDVDGYKKRLDTADIAEKMDQIADFAQSPSIARWSQIATSLGFGFTMGANVSSALNIMFDMPMAVAPYLAGEYGTRKSTKALGVANRLFMGSPSTKMVTVMNENGVLETVEVKQRAHNKGAENYNFDDPNLDPEVKRIETLVKRAGARGMFNQSIDQEHVDLSETRDVITKISEVSGFLVHHGERYSRQITLIASYNLELEELTGGK